MKVHVVRGLAGTADTLILYQFLSCQYFISTWPPWSLLSPWWFGRKAKKSETLDREKQKLTLLGS